MSIQDTLRQIQEEARRKAAETIAKYSPAAVAVPEPAQKGPDAASLQLLREEVSGAVAKAICAKVSQNYVGDLVEKIHDVATEKIQQLKDYAFDRHAIQTDDNQITLFPRNCRFFMQSEDGNGVIIFEDEPQLRTIFTNSGTSRIALPYLVFVISFVKKIESILQAIAASDFVPLR